MKTEGTQHIFEIQVYPNGLDPDSLRVELYADGVNGDDPVMQKMTQIRSLADKGNGYVYSAQVPAARPVTDYSARVIPFREGVSVPLEAAQILWQK